MSCKVPETKPSSLTIHYDKIPGLFGFLPQT